MNAKLTIPALLIFACLLAAGAYWGIFTGKPVYKTAQPVIGTAVEAVYATAVVEPVNWAAISPIKTGRITEIRVKEGDVVRQGDILALLDDGDLRAQLEEMKALAEYFDKEVERSTRLLKTGAISRERHDERKTELAQTNARIKMIEEKILQLKMISPIDGEVLWRDVEQGEVSEAGKILFWVGKPNPLQLEAEVDEQDIPKVKKGQNVLITADAFPGEYLEGHVEWISPKGDPVNKSYRVYIRLPETTKLMIGMTTEANIIIQEKENALLLPAEAVFADRFVWLAHEEGKTFRAEKKQITTGLKGNGHTEITEGLLPDQTILMPPYDGLHDGDHITIK